MSDFQISLIIIGIIIIVGVAIFNWYQQLNYRKKVESAFNREHDDVLLHGDSSAYEMDMNKRVEPQLNKEILAEFQTNKKTEPVLSTEVKSDNIASLHTAKSTETCPQIEDEAINYIVLIQADSPIPSAQINNLVQRKIDFDKPVYWFGQTQNQDCWSEVTLEKNIGQENLIALKGCLQLVDRFGPVSEVTLSKFRDITEDFASQIGAKSDCPDITDAHERAILLDKFCAEVDVMIGITIISRDDGAFVGTKIRALAEASGFKLDTDGLFKFRDDNENVLFTLSNNESTPFLSDNIRTLTTHGVTFLLDIPRIANGEKVFDQLIHLAKLFSNTLGGILVDDNHVPLSDNGLAKSKRLLINIQTAMQEHKIPAGSRSALQLFM